MEIRVHYYAAARELAGCESATFELPGDEASQDALRHAVSARFPALRPYLERMRLAVNGDFVDRSRALHDGDRIDVLPPVAGGAALGVCDITEDRIDPERVRSTVEHPGAGGVCVFHGVVRDHAEGKSVTHLHYEAHESLAEKEMRRVLDEVVAEHPGIRLAAVHRVGTLDVGEIAVCVAASAPHRAEAFTACREAIDRIKETVPIWKKEWDVGGESHWVNLED
jgi:molybdopterin synthase catalytic subunit